MDSDGAFFARGRSRAESSRNGGSAGSGEQTAQACQTGQAEISSAPQGKTIQGASCLESKFGWGRGFEPRLTESESAVLPLNYPPTRRWLLRVQRSVPSAGLAGHRLRCGADRLVRRTGQGLLARVVQPGRTARGWGGERVRPARSRPVRMRARSRHDRGPNGDGAVAVGQYAGRSRTRPQPDRSGRSLTGPGSEGAAAIQTFPWRLRSFT